MSIGSVLNFFLQLFILALFGRLILDYARMFSPTWRPRGVILFIAEVIYGITDPVMKVARRYIPPLRIGPISLDLTFLVIFFAVQMLSSLTHLIP